MRVTFDRETCIGSGQCALALPTVFDQDDHDGLVRPKESPPPGVDFVDVMDESLDAALETAVRGCPAGALALVDEPPR